MSEFLSFSVVLVVVAALVVAKGLKVVPQQEAWVVERLGKFYEVMEPGLNIIIPFVDRVAYKHCLKEVPLDCQASSELTPENVV